MASFVGPQPPQVEHGWWYQYYFATERGRAGKPARFCQAHVEGQAKMAAQPGPRRPAIKGAGHNLPQEAPQAFAKAVVEVDGY
jgi:hypothetical protein